MELSASLRPPHSINFRFSACTLRMSLSISDFLLTPTQEYAPPPSLQDFLKAEKATPSVISIDEETPSHPSVGRRSCNGKSVWMGMSVITSTMCQMTNDVHDGNKAYVHDGNKTYVHDGDKT